MILIVVIITAYAYKSYLGYVSFGSRLISGQTITHQKPQNEIPVEDVTEHPLEHATESPRLFLRC